MARSHSRSLAAMRRTYAVVVLMLSSTDALKFPVAAWRQWDKGLLSSRVAAVVAATVIASTPDMSVAAGLPSTLLAEYQTPEQAISKSREVDAKVAKDKANAVKKEEAAKLKAAKDEAKALAAAEAKALALAKDEASRMAKDETKPAAKVADAAPARASKPVKAEASTSVKKVAEAKPAKAEPITPKSTNSGPPAKLTVAADPSDVGIAIRKGALALPRGVDITTARVPSSIGVTLPVVGPVRVDLAVSIAKTSEAEAAASDVVIQLPKDLIKAGKRAVGGDAGIALDVPGIAAGRFAVDLNTPRKGEADVVVTSNLIPKLPVQKTKGAGSFCFECGDGNEPSDWFVARNLGNGVQFYGNAKTGQSQFEVPKGF